MGVARRVHGDDPRSGGDGGRVDDRDSDGGLLQLRLPAGEGDAAGVAASSAEVQGDVPRGGVGSVADVAVAGVHALDVDSLERNEAMAERQREAWNSDDWQRQSILGSIDAKDLAALRPQGDFDSFENLYAISNAAGLTMAETTCEATLLGLDPAAEGGPLFDIGALSKLAMRVCATARCAIRVMGKVAEMKGYYAAELRPPEAGEALAIADGNEAWLFHVIPDFTGRSAVWVAKQVPPDSVAICANSFVVRGVEESSNDCLFEEEEEEDCDFLASPNVEENALLQEKNLGFPLVRDPNGLVDFAATFGPRPDNKGYPYSTHRVWRVMSLLAPKGTKVHVQAALLDKKADYLGSELPFAIKVEGPVTARDVIEYQRDYFEGTPFDLTKGLAAGPWGDPTRYDGTYTTETTVEPSVRDVVPRDLPALQEGRFERAISMFRTSYCVVAQSWGATTEREGVLWYSQGTPHAGVFVPLRLDGGDVPATFRRGSLFEYSPESMFWATQLVANWMRANIFRLAREDVRLEQRAFETKALASLSSSSSFSNADLANEALETWSRLFAKLVTKYHDGFRLMTGGDEPRRLVEPDVHRFFYPDAWLKQVGYYSPKKPDAYYEDDAPPPTDSTDAIVDTQLTTTAWSGGGGKQQVPFTLARGHHKQTEDSVGAFVLATKALLAVALLAFGIVAGITIEKRRQHLRPILTL
eukprot:CAMPEP_0118896698 /NCGR_PEP_ID=MMETSP1166-20130328/4436_1 /TAXON_ID=1104430 /ORGANISM="Chrysoreinhardia sp, Strain CCMP3193" /LENGTH=699 /DNA_ID=CAMNT_0006835757 /DNA_START=240 /DNA_END=2340 /DNA_ORIENTATION=+